MLFKNMYAIIYSTASFKRKPLGVLFTKGTLCTLASIYEVVTHKSWCYVKYTQASAFAVRHGNMQSVWSAYRVPDTVTDEHILSVKGVVNHPVNATPRKLHRIKGRSRRRTTG